jgi:hypothetical protein
MKQVPKTIARKPEIQKVAVRKLNSRRYDTVLDFAPKASETLSASQAILKDEAGSAEMDVGEVISTEATTGGRFSLMGTEPRGTTTTSAAVLQLLIHLWTQVRGSRH